MALISFGAFSASALPGLASSFSTSARSFSALARSTRFSFRRATLAFHRKGAAGGPLCCRAGRSAPVAGEDESSPVQRRQTRLRLLALGQFLVLLAEAASFALLEDGQLGTAECLSAGDDLPGVPGPGVELAHQRLRGP